MILTARTRPITVKCIQWTGDNREEVTDFLTSCGETPNFWNTIVGTEGGSKQIGVVTWETSNHIRWDADEGDYIIKSLTGGCYACKREEFIEKYEILKKE